MSTHSLDHVWSLPGHLLARFEQGAPHDTKSLALVDETVAIRRCAMHRKAFKGSAVSYPAAFLGFDAVTEWIRRHRVTVDVATADELDRALAAGIAPSRIVVHPGSGAAAAIRHAVNLGAARFVVNSSRHIATLADGVGRTQRVVIDVTDAAADTLASEVLAHRGLDLIGLHCRLDDTDDAIGALRLHGLIAEMSWIRREHSVLLTRISVAGFDVGERGVEARILRRIAEAMGEVIGDACARHRYPRPALTLAPRRSALLSSR